MLAITASGAIILAAPFVGEIRGAVQAAFPGQYRSILVTIVGGAVAVAIAAAIVQIRERRLQRYGLLALALGIGAGYAAMTGSGNAEVDAVEHFHFIEYGVLALLYHRVWRERNDLSTFALPMLAGLLVGTFDEWVQWFIPFRVGEMRDVLLNGIALACGLLFSAGLYPPGQWLLLRSRDSRVAIARVSVMTMMAWAIFFHTVHLGHEVRLPPASRFMSRFSEADLASAALDRTDRWATDPPVEGRFSREDHYLSEGRWHIQERNEAVTSGDIAAAWHEERILEAFYDPVLRVLPDARWPAAQRTDVEARARTGPREYSSDAHPHPIYPWSPAWLWAAAAGAIAVIAWSGFLAGAGRRAGASQAA